MNHSFTSAILDILKSHFGPDAESVYKYSDILQYLNRKTKSANRGSKSRGSFANIYAIYVLVEDYISKGFHLNVGYDKYEGAIYSDLFRRQRELPFGSKLQNHALNNRLNSEFAAWFPDSTHVPILRTATSERYWINEHLLSIRIGEQTFNIAVAILDIISAYITAKQRALTGFLEACEMIKGLPGSESDKVIEFIESQLQPNVDARLFEIVSYAILKYYYINQSIYWGFEYKLESIKEERLKLYKTGRTNANDGGIDFVMKPLGRFFQVTETLDFKKYFLDIDKLEKFPITFVIKSNENEGDLLGKIERDAYRTYSVRAIVQKYLKCIEEIINIPKLKTIFTEALKLGYLSLILEEIIIQSKVEFHYDDTESDDSDEEDCNDSDAQLRFGL